MIAFRVHSLEATTSTNDEVKQALEAGEAEGLAVRARQQSGGYGRQGRIWASPVGGLYQSLLLRPCVSAEMLPTLSPVISLAVRRALAALVHEDNASRICIKWPNDIVISAATPASEPFAASPSHACESFTSSSTDSCESLSALSIHAREPFVAYQKLCGISLEVHAGGVCVGTGVNVRKPVEETSIDGKNVPAYLPDLGFSGTVDDVGDAILAALAPLYEQWQVDGFVSLLEEYNAHAYLTNRWVRVVDRAGAFISEGRVLHIDEHGRLVLEDDTGTLFPVSSGEAHLS